MAILEKKILKALEKKNSQKLQVQNLSKKKLLEILGEIENSCSGSGDLERSYKQFKAQTRKNNKFKLLLTNLALLFAFPFLIIFLLSRKDKKASKQDQKKSLHFNIFRGTVPESLTKEFPQHTTLDSQKGILSLNDLRSVLEVFLFSPFEGLFYSKIVWEMGIYSNIIRRYRPSAIIVHNEFSFSCSYMTKFCEQNSVEHICVMHGEKLFQLRDPFFRFHRMYVWDEHYKNLFIKLRAEPTQFIVELAPQSKEKKIENSGEGTIKYYSQIFDGPEHLNKVITALKEAKGRFGCERVVFRLHPKYSKDWEGPMIESAGFRIEANEDIDLYESLNECEYVCSEFSTVLMQAYFFGNKVLLDNSRPQLMSKLEELDYMMLSKQHYLLVPETKVS